MKQSFSNIANLFRVIGSESSTNMLFHKKDMKFMGEEWLLEGLDPNLIENTHFFRMTARESDDTSSKQTDITKPDEVR